jgi:thymidylate synthase (FAD)
MKIDVLDKGYVRYDKHMGSDLDVVNSAKVSFDRASASFEEKEARLLAFLAREEHTSVFRHSAVTLEVYAPLLTARQWFKYAIASSHVEDQFGWNESSRRYITENVEFYLPGSGEWRSAPENKKQGSGKLLPKWEIEPEIFDYQLTESVQREYGNYWSRRLVQIQLDGEDAYNDAIDAGIAPEQARLFLPAYGLYVRWRWTFSLGAGLHFLHQRLAHDAQSEIRSYAEAVKTILAEHFPKSVEATLELI